MTRNNHRPTDNDRIDTMENDFNSFEQLPERVRVVLNYAPIRYSSTAALEIYQEHGEAVLLTSLLETILAEFPGFTVARPDRAY
jgi:uncharacterized protein (DUF1919 family)